MDTQTAQGWEVPTLVQVENPHIILQSVLDTCISKVRHLRIQPPQIVQDCSTYLVKNVHISGPMQVKPVWSKGPQYTHTCILNESFAIWLIQGHIKCQQETQNYIPELYSYTVTLWVKGTFVFVHFCSVIYWERG